jgi:hypothetical protein
VDQESVISNQTPEENKMSIFGDLDVSNISDDPFKVEPNTYKAVVTESGIKEKNGNKGFTFKWTIDEPDSDFHGRSVSEYYSLPATEDTELMSSEEKRSISFLKKRLREAFDFSPEEVNSASPDDLMRKEA